MPILKISLNWDKNVKASCLPELESQVLKKLRVMLNNPFSITIHLVAVSHSTTINQRWRTSRLKLLKMIVKSFRRWKRRNSMANLQLRLLIRKSHPVELLQRVTVKSMGVLVCLKSTLRKKKKFKKCNLSIQMSSNVHIEWLSLTMILVSLMNT